MNDLQNSSIVDRFIGLAAFAVGLSVLYFAVQLRADPNSPLPMIRKVVGIVIAIALMLYGLYAMIVG